MQIPESCDVAVIGGGPAGSIASTLLAQKGHKVVLLEKQLHPRYAVGENLIPDFWKYCDMVGVTEKIEAEGFIKKAAGLVTWKGTHRKNIFSDFGYNRPALHVERDRFDHILLSNAKEKGVAVYENVAVTQTDFETTTGVEISYRMSESKNTGKLQCQYVVDASGQNSVVGRQLGTRVIDNNFRFMAIWGYFEGGAYLDIDGNAHPYDKIEKTPPVTYVTSLSDADDFGWVWYIVLRDKVSVGIVFPSEYIKTIRNKDEQWEDWFVRKCGEVPVIKDLLATANYCKDSVRITRDYSYRSTQVAGPGYFLVGDAAGFVDPVFSVGVVFSMYSASAAAWAIDRSLQKPETATRNQALYNQQLQGRLEVARSLALPQYLPTGPGSNLARETIKMERRAVQQLMHVASSMTTRSDNFKDLLAGDKVAEMEDGQLRAIDHINSKIN